MKGATYVGNETCASCHEDQVKNYKLSTHGRLQLKGVDGVAEGCEICHGPGSIHAESGGGKGVAIINPTKDPSICFSCHMEKKMEFNLPNHHPVLEGKMSCSDCHDPHGDANPTATSMESVNDSCFKCHKDQQGPFLHEHPALREGCASCHKVHGSINEKLLISGQSNLCLKCHTQTNFPTVGANSHSSRLYQGNCWASGCHFDVHGSNYNDHFRD
ncbi:MAG: hypothetical protein HQL21_00360 [Candidatus Omnitrophica bacterium]|nr:hypothetical protein [Candidatus Omnitrophota bacterium]